MKIRSLDEIANTTAKSEVDHWVNIIFSISTIFFSLIWWSFWVFLLSAFVAILFDMQFIVVQRYNRPKMIRVYQHKNKKKNEA